MTQLSLSEILQSSLHRAERDLGDCTRELNGETDLLLYHRNNFHYIAGMSSVNDFYADQQDVQIISLAERARKVVEERDIFFDAICRRYLDVEDMNRVFAEAESPLRPCGKYITGADVLNYVSKLIKTPRGENILAIAQKIGREYHASSERRSSVEQEVGIFRDYIEMCRRKLGALAATVVGE